MVYWERARQTGRPTDRGSNPNADRFVYYYLFLRTSAKLNNDNNTGNNRNTSGTPQLYLEDREIQGVKILLNGDWQSSLDRSMPT